MITLIAACSENLIIGNDNKLLWHIPNDLKRFKSLTSGNPIVMGGKTFDSIGKPLPNRTNIVLTRDKNKTYEGCKTYNNTESILNDYRYHNLFIIGGGEIYKQFIDVADKIELTLIDKHFDGDTYFPPIDLLKWKELKRESHTTDDFTYHYITYIKNYQIIENSLHLENWDNKNDIFERNNKYLSFKYDNKIFDIVFDFKGKCLWENDIRTNIDIDIDVKELVSYHINNFNFEDMEIKKFLKELILSNISL
jgi:dihydrofolate reductase